MWLSRNGLKTTRHWLFIEEKQQDLAVRDGHLLEKIKNITQNVKSCGQNVTLEQKILPLHRLNQQIRDKQVSEVLLASKKKNGAV